MSRDPSKDSYSEKEAKARFETALKGGLNTSPKPLKEKPKVKGHKSGKSPLPKPQVRPNKGPTR